MVLEAARPVSELGTLHSSRSRQVLIAAGTLSLVCVAFLPTLVHDFVPPDQWRAFRYSIVDQGVTARARECVEMIPRFYLATGRPLVWLGECAEHAWVGRIRDFAMLRPIALAALLLTSVALGQTLKRLLGSFAAGLIAGAVCTLTPGYTFMYMQGLTGAPVLLAVFFATCSFELVLRADEQRPTQGKRGYGTVLSAAAGLYLIACLIYPSFAAIWAPLALVHLGFDRAIAWPEKFRRFLHTTIFFVISSVVYLLLGKAFIVVYERFGGLLPDLGEYGFFVAATPGLLLRRARDLSAFFYNETTVGNFFGWPGLVKIGLLLLPVVFLIVRTGVRREYRQALVYGLLIPAMLACGAAPLIASGFQGIGHRQTIAWEFMVVLSVAIAVAEGVKRLSGRQSSVEIALLVGLLFPAVAQQVRLSMMEVLQSDVEIRQMRSVVIPLVESGQLYSVAQLHVVRPDPGRGFANWPMRRGETGIPATGVSPDHIFQMLTAVLREAAPAEALQSLTIADCQLSEDCVRDMSGPGVLTLSQSPPDTRPLLLPGAVVLDYARLQTSPKDFGPDVPARAVSSGANDAADPMRAVDGDVSTFWEVRGRFPHWIQLDRASGRRLSAYRLATGSHGDNGADAVTRMPRSWKVLCAEDGQNWRELDRRLSEAEWRPYEARDYGVAGSPSCSRVRFEFDEGNHPDLLRIYELRLRWVSDDERDLNSQK